MADAQSKVKVAILAVPEVTASAVYAMYDLFAAAGRDWAFITTGVPGEPRMQPYVVARDDAPVLSANGISITPDHTIDDCPEPAIVCVPDFSHMPGESCAGRLEPEVAWLRRCHAGGATLASVCTSAMLMAETGLLDGHDATHPLGLCRVFGAALPDDPLASEPFSRRYRCRAAHRHGWRRHQPS